MGIVPRQRLLYRPVYLWLWLTPALPWIVLAVVETLAAFGLGLGFDMMELWLPVITTLILSLILLAPTSWICRRWVHPKDLARSTPQEQGRAVIVFVAHTILVAIPLQLPLILAVRAGTLDPASEDTATALVWAGGSFVISLVIAALVGWHAIRLVRVE